MKDLHLTGSQTTPTVTSDWEHGRLVMQGDSYPENSFEFFNQIIDWIDSYLKTSGDPLHLDLWLMYMNTSSVKAMMDIFDMLEDAHANGHKVSVCWHFDPRNERVVDLAEEFREDCTFDFQIVADE